MIRYLKQNEKLGCKKLWKDAFPEDSDSFVKYYFEDKIKDNRILAKEEDGEIIAMAHLNPYHVVVKGRVWNINYIVGVATRADKRHQGYMRGILQQMMADLYEEGQQFCFLMPADERIYRPFQFTYIFNQPQWKLKDNLMVEKIECSLDQKWLIQYLADWCEKWLGIRYQVYCQRDEAYIKHLLREVESEDGRLFALYDAGNLAGLMSFWGKQKKELRELLCGEWMMEEAASAKPAIMGRIINLQEFVKLISLKKDCEMKEIEVTICVSDPMIAENNGEFVWHLESYGSWMERTKEQYDEEPQLLAAGLERRSTLKLPMSIEDITGWLFGYHLPDLWINNKDFQLLVDNVQVLHGVFLDEVV